MNRKGFVIGVKVVIITLFILTTTLGGVYITKAKFGKTYDSSKDLLSEKGKKTKCAFYSIIGLNKEECKPKEEDREKNKEQNPEIPPSKPKEENCIYYNNACTPEEGVQNWINEQGKGGDKTTLTDKELLVLTKKECEKQCRRYLTLKECHVFDQRYTNKQDVCIEDNCEYTEDCNLYRERAYGNNCFNFGICPESNYCDDNNKCEQGKCLEAEDNPSKEICCFKDSVSARDNNGNPECMSNDIEESGKNEPGVDENTDEGVSLPDNSVDNNQATSQGSQTEGVRCGRYTCSEDEKCTDNYSLNPTRKGCCPDDGKDYWFVMYTRWNKATKWWSIKNTDCVEKSKLSLDNYQICMEDNDCKSGNCVSTSLKDTKYKDVKLCCPEKMDTGEKFVGWTLGDKYGPYCYTEKELSLYELCLSDKDCGDGLVCSEFASTFLEKEKMCCPEGTKYHTYSAFDYPENICVDENTKLEENYFCREDKDCFEEGKCVDSLDLQGVKVCCDKESVGFLKDIGCLVYIPENYPCNDDLDCLSENCAESINPNNNNKLCCPKGYVSDGAKCVNENINDELFVFIPIGYPSFEDFSKEVKDYENSFKSSNIFDDCREAANNFEFLAMDCGIDDCDPSIISVDDNPFLRNGNLQGCKKLISDCVFRRGIAFDVGKFIGICYKDSKCVSIEPDTLGETDYIGGKYIILKRYENQNDYKETFLHELGHAFGLYHIDVNTLSTQCWVAAGTCNGPNKEDCTFVDEQKKKFFMSYCPNQEEYGYFATNHIRNVLSRYLSCASDNTLKNQPTTLQEKQQNTKVSCEENKDVCGLFGPRLIKVSSAVPKTIDDITSGDIEGFMSTIYPKGLPDDYNIGLFLKDKLSDVEPKKIFHITQNPDTLEPIIKEVTPEKPDSDLDLFFSEKAVEQILTGTATFNSMEKGVDYDYKLSLWKVSKYICMKDFNCNNKQTA